MHNNISIAEKAMTYPFNKTKKMYRCSDILLDIILQLFLMDGDNENRTNHGLKNKLSVYDLQQILIDWASTTSSFDSIIVIDTFTHDKFTNCHC